MWLLLQHGTACCGDEVLCSSLVYHDRLQPVLYMEYSVGKMTAFGVARYEVVGVPDRVNVCNYMKQKISLLGMKYCQIKYLHNRSFNEVNITMVF